MSGFGFIEYEDAMDAKDVVPGKDKNPMAILLEIIRWKGIAFGLDLDFANATFAFDQLSVRFTSKNL